MLTSVRAFLAEMVDYAGLFPPAQLPLEQAIRNYAAYRSCPDVWLLSRFICPVKRLKELAPFHEELFQRGPPWAFSILGSGGKNAEEFLQHLDEDVQAIAAFRTRHGNRVTTEAFEVRVPFSLLAQSQTTALESFLHATLDLLRTLTPPLLTPHFEVEFGLPDSSPPAKAASDQRTTFSHILRSFIQALRRLEHTLHAGFKLRCGGADAAAFPSLEQLVFAIATCRDSGVPLKFTAGLHHALRHFDPLLQVHQHGFLSLFAAGVLAHAQRINPKQILEILEEQDASNFHFDNVGLRWKECSLSTEEIIAARQQGVISFGSCSFEEPRADLQALKLL